MFAQDKRSEILQMLSPPSRFPWNKFGFVGPATITKPKTNDRHQRHRLPSKLIRVILWRSITRELINNCNEFDRQLEFIKRWPHMCTLPLSVLVDSFGTEHHLRCLSKCNPPQSSPPGTPLFIRKPGSKEAAARCTLP